MPVRATADRRAAYFSAAGRGPDGRRGRGASAAVPCLAWPVSPVRAVAPEHPAGHGGHAHLVDAHGGCRRMHSLDRRELGDAERARPI
jgi:hypothetical protein